jgi:hypothetical protein
MNADARRSELLILIRENPRLSAANFFLDLQNLDVWCAIAKQPPTPKEHEQIH